MPTYAPATNDPSSESVSLRANWTLINTNIEGMSSLNDKVNTNSELIEANSENSGFRVQGFRFRSFACPTNDPSSESVSLLPASGVSVSVFGVSGVRFRVSDFGFLVSGFRFRVSDFGARVG